MKTSRLELSSKRLGRITGAVYLLIILGGLFGGLVARGNIVDLQDAQATLSNLIGYESLYRLGFMSDLIMVLSDVLVSVLFFFLLWSTHKLVAFFSMIFRLMQSSILASNLINLFSPLLLIKQHGGIEQESLAKAVLHKLELFEYGYLISGVFFAINCLLMGYLLYKSQLFPNILGVFIGIASFGYMLNCISFFIIPDLVETSQVIMFVTAVVSELSICIYLLAIGTKKDVVLEY